MKRNANSLVTIGNFDGVHRGHQALLLGAAEEAERLGLSLRLLTFDPHPALVLGRARPPLLTGAQRKRELAERLVPELEYVAHPFDLAFAAQSPREFATWLSAEQRAKRVVVGQNFRFGKGRAGDFETLVRLGGELGFTARSEGLRGDESGAWSSTRIRQAIAAGDLRGAANLLGRPHRISGRVVHGKALGKTLGFPTANLDDVCEMLPPAGVYAVLVDRLDANGGKALGLGAMSIGQNPTTDVTRHLKTEVYVMDFEGDLYGAYLAVGIVERLRPEARFESLEALVEQMNRDVAQAREVLDDFRPLAGGSYL